MLTTRNTKESYPKLSEVLNGFTNIAKLFITASILSSSAATKMQQKCEYPDINSTRAQGNTEWPYFFIHNQKTMGTTLYSQLGKQYRNKFYGYRSARNYGNQCGVRLRYDPHFHWAGRVHTRQFPIDHMSLDELVKIGILKCSDVQRISAVGIVREPFSRFVSLCNDHKVSPQRMIEDYQRKTWTDITQVRYFKQMYDWNITVVGMENKQYIKSWFKEFDVDIDLSLQRAKRISRKKWSVANLTVIQQEFVQQHFKQDFLLYNAVIEQGGVLSSKQLKSFFGAW